MTSLLSRRAEGIKDDQQLMVSSQVQENKISSRVFHFNPKNQTERLESLMIR